MSTNKKIKITCSNLDSNLDIDLFFKEINKYGNSDISNMKTLNGFDISVEVIDENTPPNNLNFKKFIAWLNR